jgi:hypothetical protein
LHQFAARVITVAVCALGIVLLSALVGSGADRRTRAGLLVAFAIIVVLFAHHPLARLHAGVRIPLAAIAAGMLGVAASLFVERWPRARWIPVALTTSACAFVVSIRDADARLALGAHALLGRDVLALAAPSVCGRARCRKQSERRPRRRRRSRRARYPSFAMPPS